MDIISVADLKIGMFVAEPDCPWTEFPFALQGFVISKPEQVDLFQTKCRFVYIDRSRSLAGHFAPEIRTKDAALKANFFDQSKTTIETPHGATCGFGVTLDASQRRRRFLDFLHRQDNSDGGRELSRELEYIEPRYDDLLRSLQQTLKAISADQATDIHSLREGLHDMSGSLKRNPDALMWLLRLKHSDQYSFDHAMDVAVNLLLLGTHIGWQGDRLLGLGLAGIFQDIGKIQLPAELLAKKTSLSADERALVQSHVASSLEILYSLTTTPPDVLLTVSRHHERWDGSGYPQGLKYEKIGIAGQMAGLIDSFCAMLKNKPYRSALGYQQAQEELFNLRDKKFNPVLIEQFVQCIGLYPIGTLVELSTGEVAVVIQQNRVKRARPRVLMILDAKKERLMGYRLLDLRDPEYKQIHVLQALPNNAYGLIPDDYYLG